MNIDAIINNIESGIIPEDKVLVESLINYFRKIDKVSESITSLIVAYSRREFFANDINGWLDWAQVDMNIKSGLHHLRKCGDLLLDMLDEEIDSYTRLIKLCRDKLLPISRLARTDVTKFLAAYKVEKMSREEIRVAVADCLGEPAPEAGGSAPKTKWQPSLWDGIEAVANFDEDDFNAIEFTDDTAARKTVYAAAGMLGASVQYWRDSENTDASYLAMVEAELRRTADTVKEIREQQAAELMNAS